MAVYPHVRWGLWLSLLAGALIALKAVGVLAASWWVAFAPILLWLAGAVALAAIEEIRYRRGLGDWQ